MFSVMIQQIMKGGCAMTMHNGFFYRSIGYTAILFSVHMGNH